jgi:hypothetical protein
VVAYDELSGFSGELIQIRASRYWPPLGGVNCGNFVDGHCISHMASGKHWEEYVGVAIACPPQWEFGTELVVHGKTWICYDRGGAIQMEDGIGWVDFLSETSPFDGYRYGGIFDAILVSP